MLLVLVALLVGSLAAPVAAQADSENGSEWTDDELERGGIVPNGAAPSMRWLSDTGSVYIDYSNPNPLVFGGASEWEAGEILSPGQTLKADSVRLNARRARAADTEEYELKVVYWREETVPRTNADGEKIGTRDVVRDVHTQSHSLTFSGAFDAAEIDLRRSQESRQVTMWLVDDANDPVDGARWTFEHHSPATTMSAGISSMGDLFGFIGWWIALPLLALIALVAVSVKWAIGQAAKGPDMGLIFWTIVGTATLVLSIAIAWAFLADLLVALPLVIPIALAFIMGVVMLETYEVGVETVEFVKPNIEVGKSPSGETAIDMISVEVVEEKVVRTGPGNIAIVRDGIRPFIARCLGGSVTLQGAEDLTTRFSVESDDSDVDQDAKIFVHPDSEDVITYETEGFELNLPEIESRRDGLEVAIVATMTLAFTGVVGWTFGVWWGFAALTAAVVMAVVRPRETFATVDIAPAHVRAAFASMLYLAQEVDNAETIEEAREKLVEKEAHSERDVEEALTKRDATLVQEMFNADVDEAVRSANGDGEVDDLVGDVGVDEDGEVAPADD